MAEETPVITDGEVPEKPAAPRTYTVVGVTFRDNPKSYYFDPKGRVFRIGDKVIVEGWPDGLYVISVRHELGSPGRMQMELASKEYIRRRYYRER